MSDAAAARGARVRMLVVMAEADASVSADLRSAELALPDQRPAARELVAGSALLIDVRRHDDDAGQLEGALRISPDMIPCRVAGFRRDVPTVLGCT